ncbi:MAG: hypothetical protein OQL19_04445 [Gammaproteobacteria bacterium]|nr:hypothetical protein [Gammaproteobacteria bacterium]
MNKYMMKSKALRSQFLFIGLVISLGIWLTGINIVHWVLFIPAFFLTFAGISGICPGLIIQKMIFGEK